MVIDCHNKQKERRKVEPIDLFQKYYQNEVSDEERQIVENWLAKSKKNKDIYNQFTLIWQHSSSSSILKDIEIEKDWNLISSGLNYRKKNKLINLSPYLKIAASVTLLIAAGLIAKKHMQRNWKNHHEIVKLINQNSDSHIFPDNSIVYTYKTAEISYVKKFNKNRRSISFKGIGYFEIKSNPDNPFYIHTGISEIIIHGTSFLLEATTDSTVVRVKNGIVELKSLNDPVNSVKLFKDEIGVCKNGKLKTGKNTDLNYLAWQTCELIFNEMPLNKVLLDIEKVYNVNFALNANESEMIKFTGKFKNKSIKEIIEVLEFTCDIDINEETSGAYIIRAN